MDKVTQEEILLNIITKMRKRIRGVGPCHAWWDVIMDMEALLNSKRCIVEKSMVEWIQYGEELLGKRGL